MKFLGSLFVAVLLMQNLIAQTPKNTLNLMPVPSQITMQKGKFRINQDFKIQVIGNPDARIFPNIRRMLFRLDGQMGIFFEKNVSKDKNANVQIEVKRPAKLKLHEQENYILEITEDKINIRAETDFGALNALRTLEQLIENDEDGYYFPALQIEDKPRFPWRGLMLDVARHFMPMEVVKRNIDGMASVKLNVLHLHLTEDQGFRIESKKFPNLHLKGSNGEFFTQAQITEIVNYAGERGIRVVPEIDIPGHATAWFVGHPELASKKETYQIEKKFGVFDPTIDPTKDENYQFLDTFLTEISALFPDEYFHIGGDENNGKHWNQNSEIQRFMKENNLKNNHALQNYFNTKILKILTKNNKKMIGWDEILQPDLPKSIIVHSWRGKESLVNAVKEDYQVMLSNGFYVDLCKSTEHHYLNRFFPENSELTEAQKKRVIGGEATMWAELVTPENVDSRIWPRTAAIAERLWSPAEIRDVKDMYRRLEKVRLDLEYIGLMHLKNREMMMRRLTRQEDVSALRRLANLCEPIRTYSRSHHPKIPYNTDLPFTRLPDICEPDARIARQFRDLVADYLANPSAEKAQEIKEKLILWRDNHEKFAKVVSKSPILKEMLPVSQNLNTVSVVGLEILEKLQNKEKADRNWLSANLAKIKEAQQPQNEVEIKIISGIEAMIQKAR